MNASHHWRFRVSNSVIRMVTKVIPQASHVKLMNASHHWHSRAIHAVIKMVTKVTTDNFVRFQVTKATLVTQVLMA